MSLTTEIENFKSELARKVTTAIRKKENPQFTLLDFGDDELYLIKKNMINNKAKPILKKCGLDINVLIFELDRRDMLI